MVFIFSVELEKVINVYLKSRFGPIFVLWHRSGFQIWILVEHWWLSRALPKNKIENRKSGSNKFLGIPKAVQNRSKHSLRVPELSAPLTWSYRNFQNFQDLDKLLKIFTFFRQIFWFSGKSSKKYFWPKKKIGFFFWPWKNIIFFGVEKKVGVQFRIRKIISFDWWGLQSDSGTPSHSLEQFGRVR